MNICLVNTTPFWGGGEKWFYQNAVFLSGQGYHVFVLAHKDGKLWQKLEGHKSILLNHLEAGNLSFINPAKKWALRSFFARNEITTVILNSSPEVKLCGPAAKKAAVENIIYRRGSAIPVKGTLINKSLYGKVVTHVIANSEATKTTFLENLHETVSPGKVHVIPNGITLPEPISQNRNDVLVVGSLGRMVHQKGFDFALEAARMLKEQNFKFRWLIAGGGALHDHLVDKANEYKLSGEVEFMGEVTDTSKFFSAIDLFVHTARWEGFGFAIAEAMAHEKAVVAFDVSSNPELIEHNKTGVLVEMGNVEALVSAIISFNNDREILKAMGGSGREAIEKGFTVEKQQERLLSFLKSLA